MGFTDRPDYSYLRKMLDAVLFRAQYSDYSLDWKIQHVRLIAVTIKYPIVKRESAVAAAC